MAIEPTLPSVATMVQWIEAVVAQGVRRPGYRADRWAEEFIHDQFVELGLESVRYEPVECTYWEDRSATLEVHRSGSTESFECFPVPLSEPVRVEGEIVAWDPRNPSVVEGKIAVYDVRFFALPEAFPVFDRRTGQRAGDVSDPLAAAGWAFDPDDTFETGMQVLPFPIEIQNIMEPAIAAGAIGFVGVLRDYPGGGREYYVPYDGEPRSIPGVYINERDGDRLTELLSLASSTATLEVDARRTTITSRNVVGELEGADDEWVIVATHHDGPWASAVEDGSGIALLLAQASAWAKVAVAERPHRLVFLASAAHMSGGAGTEGFIARHLAMMDKTVLELHLEHAALETTEIDGELPASSSVTPRWWFTSEIPVLERSVWDAITSQHLDRSLVLVPEALGDRPTTDGGFFHSVGVPLVNYLAAPWYLFDPADTIDKVDGPTLGSLSRATFAIVQSTTGVSAAQMRQGHVAQSPSDRGYVNDLLANGPSHLGEAPG